MFVNPSRGFNMFVSGIYFLIAVYAQIYINIVAILLAVKV